MFGFNLSELFNEGGLFSAFFRASGEGQSNIADSDKLVFVNAHNGIDDQIADSDLVQEAIGFTSNHRLRGTTYLYARLKYD